MDGEQVRSFNLRVLKNHDTEIVDILDQTTHVVVYQFDAEDSNWTKAGIAGTAFIIERRVYPTHKLLLFNRQGVENFVISLDNDRKIESAGEFLLLRDNDMKVWGLWVFEPTDRERFAQNLFACTQSAQTHSQSSPQSRNEHMLSSLFELAANDTSQTPIG